MVVYVVNSIRAMASLDWLPEYDKLIVVSFACISVTVTGMKVKFF